mgnify:CR=1 FL=1
MGEVSNNRKNEVSEFELDTEQWDVIEEDAAFAWSGPDGRPLMEEPVELPLVEPEEPAKSLAFQSDEIELPPERVRFATLVNIKVVGEKDYDK